MYDLLVKSVRRYLKSGNSIIFMGKLVLVQEDRRKVPLNHSIFFPHRLTSNLGTCWSERPPAPYSSTFHRFDHFAHRRPRWTSLKIADNFRWSVVGRTGPPLPLPRCTPSWFDISTVERVFRTALWARWSWLWQCKKVKMKCGENDHQVTSIEPEEFIYSPKRKEQLLSLTNTIIAKVLKHRSNAW